MVTAKKNKIAPIFLGLALSALLSLFGRPCAWAEDGTPFSPDEGLESIERRVSSYLPDPRYPHDQAALETLREALKGKSGRNGGIGACLVQEETGEIVARGHNRQYSPYFRSDLHAEMDLLTRYEESLKIPRDPKDGIWNPRGCYRDLVLFTSIEPCPMCLTRIINAGIRKVYYVAPDKEGGMATRLDALPPFWRDLTKNRSYLPAQCSPALQDMALKLFGCPNAHPGPTKKPNEASLDTSKSDLPLHSDMPQGVRKTKTRD